MTAILAEWSLTTPPSGHAAPTLSALAGPALREVGAVVLIGPTRETNRGIQLRIQLQGLVGVDGQTLLSSAAVVRRWRAVGAFGAAAAAIVPGLVVLGVLMEFLAPDLSYQFRDRALEVLSGQRDRKFRIALDPC
jgi:hypothetical protein